MNKSSGIPQYLCIADELRAKLMTMPIGAPLDPEQALAAEYGVSRDTVRRALDVLVREGILTRERGRGSFRSEPKETLYRFAVEPTILDSIRRVGIESRIRNLSISLVPAPPEIAELLKIPPHTKVRRVTRVRMAEDKPFAYGAAYLRTDMVPQIFRREFKTSLAELIMSNRLLHIESRHVEFRAELADPTVAEALSVPVGSAVLHVNLLCEGYGGVPMLVDTFCFPSSQVLHFSGPH